MAWSWSDPFNMGGGTAPYGPPSPNAGNPYGAGGAFTYDPATIRRAALSNALLSAGAAMLSQGPSRVPINFGTSLGAGLGAGLQGAQEGVNQAVQRQQIAQQNLLGGQAFEQGRIGLAGSYGNLAMQAERLRRITGKPVSVQDLLAHPEMMGNYFRPPAQQGGTGLNPAAQGGQPESVWQQPGQQQAGGGEDQGAEPQAGSRESMLAGFDQAINDDYLFNDGKGVASLEARRAELEAAPAQGAATTIATKGAEFDAPGALYDRVTKLAGDFSSEAAVKNMQVAGPTMQAIYAAAQSKTETSDADLANGVLKMWNPELASPRPGFVSSLDDMKGIDAQIQKLIQSAQGGTKLIPEARAALVASAEQHMKALKDAYASKLGAYQDRAKLLGGNVPQSAWTGEPATPQQPAMSTAPEGTIVTNGSQKLVKRGGQWVPLP